VLRRLAAAVVLGLALSGCAHRVRIASDPPGAEVRYRGKVVGNTPVEFTRVWLPFARMPVELRLPGQRRTRILLGRDTGPFRLLFEVLRPWRWPRWWGGQVRTRHHVVMVRRHGPAGTWEAEEALQGR